MGASMDTCINLADIEALARAKLAGSTTWDYYEGGAEDEYTVAENCAAFRRIKLRPRVLVDVAARDLSTEILGQRIALPVLLGPTTYQRLAHRTPRSPAPARPRQQARFLSCQPKATTRCARSLP